MITTVLSLLTLAVLLMLFGAVLQWRRGERRKAALLVILALLAEERIPLQTIAPKFTGRFKMGNWN